MRHKLVKTCCCFHLNALTQPVLSWPGINSITAMPGFGLDKIKVEDPQSIIH